MFRMIRCGSGFDPVIMVSSPDAGSYTPGAKYYRRASWQIDGQQRGVFNEISRDEAIGYFSGIADGIGFETLPKDIFETLEAALQYIEKKQNE